MTSLRVSGRTPSRGPGGARLRAVALAWCAATLVPTGGLEEAAAQAVATPNSHWGAIMLPDLGHRTDWGVHFIGFTEYGKEVQANTAIYTFEPYNDIRETLGFNYVAVSHSDDGRRFPVTQSSLQVRSTAFLGIVDDHVTEFFQNDVAHWANYRGADRLRRVPRTPGDTPQATSHGPTKAVPIIGYAREYFIRFDERRSAESYELASPSKFFVGGGFVASTINHEAFLHVGTNPVDIGPREPKCLLTLCFDGVGLGGMLRWGVLLPSVHLRDLTADYTQTQAVLDLNALFAGFPVGFSAAITGTRGFFAEPRTPQDVAQATRDGREPEDVFHTKRPKRERFIAARLRIGSFSFEFLNDNVGGKDKGPSFGIHAAFETGGDHGIVRFLRMTEDGS